MNESVKKPTCEYCGNNPVPHILYWYNESLNILLTPLRQKLLYNPFSQFIKNHLAEPVQRGLLRALIFFHIITLQPDPAKCKVRRAQVLWEEGERRGIRTQELLLFGRPFDVYVAKGIRGKELGVRNEDQGKSEIIFSGLPRPRVYNNPKLDLMDDKWLFKKMMMDAGLPVPTGKSVSNLKQAADVFNQIQQKSKISNPKSEIAPIIVKPRAGSRGRHTTTFVYNTDDLKKAFAIAQQLCHWVMVEEQLFGPVYRGTVINFKTEGVLRGDSPQVVGDGQHTVRELVEAKNSLPHPGVKNIVLDDIVSAFVKKQMSNVKCQMSNVLQYVPEHGQNIYLSEKVGVSYGGSSSEDFEICHPDNKQLFEQAAKVLGDPIVGFDFIIADITKSYKEQKCGFIEVNTLPFINLHHDPLLGQPRNVASAVWEMVGW